MLTTYLSNKKKQRVEERDHMGDYRKHKSKDNTCINHAIENILKLSWAKPVYHADRHRRRSLATPEVHREARLDSPSVAHSDRNSCSERGRRLVAQATLPSERHWDYKICSRQPSLSNIILDLNRLPNRSAPSKRQWNVKSEIGLLNFIGLCVPEI